MCEMDTICAKSTELLAENTRLKDMLKMTNKDLEILGGKVAHWQNEVTSMQDIHNEEMRRSKEKLKDMQHELAAKDEEVKALKAAAAAQQTNGGFSIANSPNLMESYHRLHDQVRTLQDQLRDAREANFQVNKENDQLYIRDQQIRETYRATKHALTELQAKEVMYETQIVQMQNEIMAEKTKHDLLFKEQQVRKDGAIANLQRKVAALDKGVDLDAFELLKVQCETFKADFKTEREARQKLHEEKFELQGQVNALKKELDKVSAAKKPQVATKPQQRDKQEAVRPEGLRSSDRVNNRNKNAAETQKGPRTNGTTPAKRDPEGNELICPLCGKPFGTVNELSEHAAFCDPK